MAQTGTDLTRISEELLDAFNRSDWDRMRAMIAPDLMYIETGTGRRVEGADAYIELAQGWKRAFPDTTGTIRNILVVDDTVAEEIRWESTHTGPLETPNGTIEATNRRVATDASHWTRFDGELAREMHHYVDVFSLLGQIGALPQ
jgi:predicted ester cyclase